MYLQPFVSRGNVENFILAHLKMFNFDNDVISMFLLKLTRGRYNNMYIEMLFDCSLSWENEWLLSRDIPRKQIVIFCKETEKNDYFRVLQRR